MWNGGCLVVDETCPNRYGGKGQKTWIGLDRASGVAVCLAKLALEQKTALSNIPAALTQYKRIDQLDQVPTG